MTEHPTAKPNDGEPNALEALGRLRKAWASEDSECTEDPGRILEASLSSPQPEPDIRSAAQAVVDAAAQTKAGEWIITGDGEVLIGALVLVLAPIRTTSCCRSLRLNRRG